MGVYQNQHECIEKKFLNGVDNGIRMSRRIIYDEWLLMTKEQSLSIYFCPFCGKKLVENIPNKKYLKNILQKYF